MLGLVYPPYAFPTKLCSQNHKIDKEETALLRTAFLNEPHKESVAEPGRAQLLQNPSRCL